MEFREKGKKNLFDINIRRDYYYFGEYNIMASLQKH